MKSIPLLLTPLAKVTSPNPVTLYPNLGNDAGVTNLAETCTWWTYHSIEPAVIGFAMMKPSYTG